MTMVRGLSFMLALAALAPAAQAQQASPTAPLPPGLVAPRLERFASEAELRTYLRRVQREAKLRDLWAGLFQPFRVAQNVPQDVPCTDPKLCPPDTANDSVVVTGSRITSKPATITNVQEAGVDEGDIVKQIGRFLLVLQDGRIFSIDTGGNGLKLVDRANVYRDASDDMWYDEMLVAGNQVLITGYSYREDATELSVFRLGPSGKLERRGTFLLSSDDYYDTSNYATRLVGDSLVVYSPLDLSDVDPDKKFDWPLIRRWVPEKERDDSKMPGRHLFDARSIYKPVQPTLQPTVHTVSVCPLGPVARGGDLACRATAVMGPPQREFYVTPSDVYLWVTPGWNEYDTYGWAKGGKCGTWGRKGPSEGHPAMAFRLPVNGAPPTAMAAAGLPSDQFSFDVSGGRLRALLRFVPIACDERDADRDRRSLVKPLKLLDVPLSAFGNTPGRAPRRAYRYAPSVGSNYIENRFTDKYVVYAGRQSWHVRPPEKDEVPGSATVVALPLRGGSPTTLSVPHNLNRLERMGDDMMLDGYRDQKGLSVSVLDLSRTPHLTVPVLLADRFESEGRSHAFNAMIGPKGDGLFGLPTVARGDDDNWWWRSEASDVSFLAVDTRRQARRIGELESTKGDAAVDESYKCEVSCIDWYGNTRPIFTDGRIFALSGTELIEGTVTGDRIREIRRLNLSRPVDGK
ncbi:beta-propeller domain-containing protein [Sphingomonas sp. HITSZ_GF]|uniref:beta-propeller domain-containing protein n=1 Tax=Sphingomonas sp. HITSZ_GF TaxID=3037247 RepID=UPI00240D1559|nr:beta-propeller domain-containing protein [Sphingomonas sp. HITSZ_GF]MDG2532389.1 beta-propeller domain-containing protein [Sphingomonas sp. HITSZ_GF]